jgi:hypothetical protein
MCCAVGLVVPSAGAGRSRASACSGGRTLAQTVGVRVFTKHVNESDRVFVCARASRRSLRIGELDPDTPAGVDSFVIAGSMVGFHRYVCDHGGLCDMNVVVVNARKRTTVHKSAAMEGFLRSLVLAPSGSVAWIRASGLADELSVGVIDASGERLLDQGPGIDPSSLALGTGRLYWLDGGQAQTAQLD